jgi:hypothetical protein
MVLFLFLLLLFPTAAFAHDGHDAHPPADVGEAVVLAELSCNGLTKDQVYGVGVYLYDIESPKWWVRFRARVGYCW